MGRSGPVTKDTSTVALGLAQVRIGTSAANIATITEVLTSANSIGALANTKFTGPIDYWKLESGFPLLEDLAIPLRESATLECAFKEIIPFNIALARGIDPLSAISSTITFIASDTVGGGTSGVITVDDAGGVETEQFTIVFTDATNYKLYGADAGYIGTSLISVLYEPDNGGNPYVSIPANFFDASWLADETYNFNTTAAVAAAGGYDNVHVGNIGLGAMLAPAYMRMEAVYTYPNGNYKMVIIYPRANITSSIELDFQPEDNINVPLTIEAKNSTSDVNGGHAVWDSHGLGIISFLAT